MDQIGNKNLCLLDGERFDRARTYLNITDSPQHGWRAIVSALDGEYALTKEQVTKLASTECPAESLLKELGGLGMTIDEFISFIAKTEDTMLMEIFSVQSNVYFIEHPVSELVCQEGNMMTLYVRAKGFPEPQYQWYKDDRPIRGAIFKNYTLNDVEEKDSGSYFCIIFQGMDTNSVKFSNRSRVIVTSAPPLEVIGHPSSTPAMLGGNALLKCSACGPDGLKYQWFKASSKLNDGPTVHGAESNELRLYNIDEHMLGVYQCRISFGQQEVWTQGAALQIDQLLRHSKYNKYTAADKVALLIGCSDYRGDKILKAPPNDVRNLASIFQSLNFKVVSLLNLTRKELIAAVLEFKELVNKGVYCVFYFGGHGFEVSKEVFLVPWDAPNGYRPCHCVSANKICNQLLLKNPRMLCVILDVCRRPIKIEDESDLERPEPVKHGNTLVVYSTSYGLAAYEDFNSQHSILVSHLKNCLSLPISVEDVFAKLRHAVGSDPKVSCGEEGTKEKRQIPQISTNLTNPGMSFADPIKHTNFTAQYNERRNFWEYAHSVPKPRTLYAQFPDFSVKVRLEFEQVCSNVLNIYTTVVDPGLSKSCVAWVNGISRKIQEHAKVMMLNPARGTGLSRIRVCLQNIHRLQDEFKITVRVNCSDLSLSQNIVLSDLDMPLFSVLRLWEDRPDFTKQHFPEEAPEGSDCDDIDESNSDIYSQSAGASLVAHTHTLFMTE